jgi:muramidase (phage lysozyme)
VSNTGAFLDMLAWSEIGPGLLAKSDNGYNVCVGSTADAPILFDSYATHPRRRCEELDSDAAGRYQEMGRFWLAYKNLLRLPDFGPASQDRWAIQLIRECHALDDIEAGRIESAIVKCKSRWASLPGAGYGQHEQLMTSLIDAYRAAGGKLA